MSEAGAATPEDPLGEFVHRTVSGLWHGYHQNRAADVAALAKLRRSYPHDWKVQAESFAFLGDRFDHGPRDEDGASFDERAAAAALALYALHQQSNTTTRMHRRGAEARLGRAAAKLRALGRGAGVERRMNAIVTSPSPEATLEHLRGLVQLLRSDAVPLDYAALARNLRAIHTPVGLRSTCIRWSRDFEHGRNDETDDSNPTPGAEA